MSEQPSEQPAAPHPTEGLPDYERERHDAIQSEYQRHSDAVGEEDKRHADAMEQINAKYADAAESDTPPPSATNPTEVA